MPDNVAYVVECYCGESIYASWCRVRRRVLYHPELYWSPTVDVHEPITRCLKCGRDIRETERQQYDEALDHLP